MNEERKRILDMLEAGKIDAQEAEKLLSALDSDEEEDNQELTKDTTEKSSALRIKVTEGGKEKVNMNIPLSIAKAVMGFIPGGAKQKIREKGIDIDEIIEEVKNGTSKGKIIDIDDEENGDKVEIFVE